MRAKTYTHTDGIPVDWRCERQRTYATSPECLKYFEAASFSTYVYYGYHAKYENLVKVLDIKPIRFKSIERIQSKTLKIDIIGYVIQTNKWFEKWSHSVSYHIYLHEWWNARIIQSRTTHSVAKVRIVCNCFSTSFTWYGCRTT